MSWNKFAATTRVTGPDCLHPETSPCGRYCAASRKSAAGAAGARSPPDGGAVGDGPAVLPASVLRAVGGGVVGVSTGGVAPSGCRLQPVTGRVNRDARRSGRRMVRFTVT